MKLFSLLIGNFVLSNKKGNLRKFSVVFFKAFSLFPGPGQTSKQNTKKNIFSAISFQQFSGKNSESN